ncbi:MAG: tetratricopeptide repeat protein [Flavobacteriales bacterium]|jgi:tetratricopeptide (TPR) repeat protein|nr:tetratricopeptide repeat protein [Flavobacteriales bacterium]|tara:strand:+ start:1971 stop:2651 length:681 start_codon:yes stop_codon:yes gene_type:complete
MAKKNNKTDDQFAKVESALTRTEQYVEDNQGKLMKIIGGIILVIAIYVGYGKFILDPLEEDAQSEMFYAEIYFAKDSFNLALNGDGQYLGFIDISDEYSGTKPGNLANYYAGLSYLHLKDYENAIDYLKEYSSDDIILSSLAIGCIGDAYLELGEQDMALEYFQDAADNNDNGFTTPRFLMKQAIVLELQEDYEGALELYKRIKSDYKSSKEGQNVTQYISRAENR